MMILMAAIGACGAPPGEAPAPAAAPDPPAATARAARPLAEPPVTPEPAPEAAAGEDEFRGRPLLDWIADFAQGDEFDPALDAAVLAAEEALTAAGERGADAVVAYVRDSGESLPPLPDLRDLLVPRLLALLQDPDEDRRAAALDQLARYASVGGYGPNDVQVAAAVVPRLHEPRAADVLRGCGPAGAKYVEPLSAALRDKEPRVRASSALGLAAIGRRAAAATDALVRCLGDNEPDVREAAVDALTAIGGRAGPGAARALADLALREPDLAEPCLDALRAMEEHMAAAVPSLVQLVASESAIVRRVLVHLLAPLLDSDPRVRPALERLGEDPDEYAAAGARIALAGEESDDDPDEPEAGDDPRPAPPTSARFRELAAAAAEDDYEVCDALRRAGPDCRDAAFEALASELPPNTRAAILEAVGNMGAAAAPRADTLRKDLADDDADVRVAAAGALFRLTGDLPATLPVLRAALAERREGIDFATHSALAILREMGPAAAPAVPELRRLLRRPLYAGAIASVCRALGAIGAPAAAALPEILPVLDGRTRAHDWCGSEDSSWIRAAAAEALGGIGTEPAITALREAIDDPAAGEVAAKSLAKLGR